jgi:excisionase family DNA binding protein
VAALVRRKNRVNLRRSLPLDLQIEALVDLTIDQTLPKPQRQIYPARNFLLKFVIRIDIPSLSNDFSRFCISMTNNRFTSQNPIEQQYCSTTQASKLLGVSLGTVQQMVEEGVLDAWKTSGGHRRILLESLQAYLSRRGVMAAGDKAKLSVLIAEDDVILQTLYQRTLESWGLPLQVQIVGNGIDGLLAVGRKPPDVLIADLNMPGVDGFEMVRTLRANPSLVDMDIIVVSGVEKTDIEARGGLPSDVAVYTKPIPFFELRGYFQALVSRKIKALQGFNRAG